MCIPSVVVRQRPAKSISPSIVRKRLSKHVPATTNTRNNKRIVGCVCLWICLRVCIPLSFVGNNSVETFPRQQRNFGGVVFQSVHVVSKECRRLVLPKISSSLIYRSGHMYNGNLFITRSTRNSSFL
jgi:hypothetical protein